MSHCASCAAVDAWLANRKRPASRMTAHDLAGGAGMPLRSRDDGLSSETPHDPSLSRSVSPTRHADGAAG